jgi:hypothetical protein
VVVNYNDLIQSLPDKGVEQTAKGILKRHEASLRAAIDDLNGVDRECPFCRGTDMDIDGDSGGGCTHCINGRVSL